METLGSCFIIIFGESGVQFSPYVTLLAALVLLELAEAVVLLLHLAGVMTRCDVCVARVHWLTTPR